MVEINPHMTIESKISTFRICHLELGMHSPYPSSRKKKKHIAVGINHFLKKIDEGAGKSTRRQHIKLASKQWERK